MRLIDAENFKGFISRLPKCKNGHSNVYDESSVLRFVENQPTAFDLESVIEKIEKRKDYLLKEFLLAEKDLSVKKNADARINEIDGIIEILKSAVNGTNGKKGG